MEHIRGRARGLSVFVLADMWAQPMIKLDHLYNLLNLVPVHLQLQVLPPAARVGASPLPPNPSTHNTNKETDVYT